MERRSLPARERINLIHAAVDRGITAIDTAPLYGFGISEEQIGAALRGLPTGSVQVLTKVGLRWDTDHGRLHFESTDTDGTRRLVRRNSRPESVRWEVEQSLHRLGVETLDLLQIHFPDIDTPIAETTGALLDLRREGKIRHIGVSNFSEPEIIAAQTALSDTPLCCVQSKYNLVQRNIERGILPWCLNHGVGVTAYSPLAEGRLALAGAGTIPDRVASAIRNKLVPFARDHGVPPATVALKWLISRPGVTAAIVGASQVSHLDEHVRALDLQIGQHDLDFLNHAFATVKLLEPWEGNRVHRIGRRLIEIVRRISRK